MVYFSPILLIFEPIEAESRRTLDIITETMQKLVQIAGERPDAFKTMPQNTAVAKIDEVFFAPKRTKAPL